jgi:hypothetical protein
MERKSKRVELSVWVELSVGLIALSSAVIAATLMGHWL